MSVEIKGYVLVNDSKVKRCYNKELGAGPLATDDEVLTLYAKFGGLIKKGAEIVKTKGKDDQVKGGEIIPNETFWNFNENKAVEVKKEVKEEPKEVKKTK